MVGVGRKALAPDAWIVSMAFATSTVACTGTGLPTRSPRMPEIRQAVATFIRKRIEGSRFEKPHAALKTAAYLRVSTRSQDLANQKLAILEFSQKRRFPIDQFIESRISSRKSPLERRIDEMLGTLEPGDRLLVSELSRLGRSLSQVIQIVETLVRRKIRFIAIKEAIEFDGKQDLRTKVMIALFGLKSKAIRSKSRPAGSRK